VDGTAGQGDEDRLYGLVEIADRQQAAVQAALEGLAAERAALAREREALAHQVQGLQAGVQGAARAAVAEGLAGAAVEVAEMQANRDEWARAGFLAKLTRCDPGNRPCMRVDERAGAFGDRSDYRVLLGY